MAISCSLPQMALEHNELINPRTALNRKWPSSTIVSSGNLVSKVLALKRHCDLLFAKLLGPSLGSLFPHLALAVLMGLLSCHSCQGYIFGPPEVWSGVLIDWCRLGSHLQIRSICHPVARPTQLSSVCVPLPSRFRSALCLPTRAQVKGPQLVKPIVRSWKGVFTGVSAVAQTTYVWMALRFERPAGAAAESFGISSILCRTRGMRASSDLKCDGNSQATTLPVGIL